MSVRLLIKWNPIAAIIGFYDSKDKQNDIYHVPYTDASDCYQFANSDASMSNTASVHCENTKENGIQKRGHKIFVCISLNKKELGFIQ